MEYNLILPPNRKQILLDWINTIDQPRCLLVSNIDDLYDGNVFLEILQIYLKTNTNNNFLLENIQKLKNGKRKNKYDLIYDVLGEYIDDDILRKFKPFENMIDNQNLILEFISIFKKLFLGSRTKDQDSIDKIENIDNIDYFDANVVGSDHDELMSFNTVKFTENEYNFEVKDSSCFMTESHDKNLKKIVNCYNNLNYNFKKTFESDKENKNDNSIKSNSSKIKDKYKENDLEDEMKEFKKVNNLNDVNNQIIKNTHRDEKSKNLAVNSEKLDEKKSYSYLKNKKLVNENIRVVDQDQDPDQDEDEQIQNNSHKINKKVGLNTDTFTNNNPINLNINNSKIQTTPSDTIKKEFNLKKNIRYDVNDKSEPSYSVPISRDVSPVNEKESKIKNYDFNKIYSKREKAELSVLRGIPTHITNSKSNIIELNNIKIPFFKFLQPTNSIIKIDYSSISKFQNIFNSIKNSTITNHNFSKTNNSTTDREIDVIIKQDFKIENEDSLGVTNTDNKNCNSISSKLKNKIYFWLIDLNILKENSIKSDDLPNICANGVLLSDLINRLEGVYKIKI